MIPPCTTETTLIPRENNFSELYVKINSEVTLDNKNYTRPTNIHRLKVNKKNILQKKLFKIELYNTIYYTRPYTIILIILILHMIIHTRHVILVRQLNRKMILMYN